MKRRKERINLTNVVFDLIQGRPKKGFAPIEIRDHPKTQAVNAPSFPYLQIYRLKRDGEITERNGRYFPIPADQ